MHLQPEHAMSAPFADPIGELIQDLVRLRRNRGLSQRDVADFMGCNAAFVCRLEKLQREEVSAQRLQAYAHAVGFRIVMVISPLG
ncbi:helix-turn-helix domain-containing protein [Amycolatopsis anabasis]|uniref:helix-turn-helix domain-containing protein n=1 Tax=Amycolatopsis anabasis TaxID=1840409 RepID=UPI001FE7D6AE|nr:helix-turn-helix domain-containing protein [Amycolatopsis anabasis]